MDHPVVPRQVYPVNLGGRGQNAIPDCSPPSPQLKRVRPNLSETYTVVSDAVASLG